LKNLCCYWETFVSLFMGVVLLQNYFDVGLIIDRSHTTE
jgi:hypothetical protein